MKHNDAKTRRPASWRFGCLLAAGLAVTAASLAQPPLPGGPPGPPDRAIDLPDAPNRKASDFEWRFPPGFELASGDEEPLRIFLTALSDLGELVRQSGELDAKQAQLVAQAQAYQRDIQRRTGMFPNFRERSRMRELIGELHRNQQDFRNNEEAMRQVAMRVALQAGPVRRRLQDLREAWETTQGSSESGDANQDRPQRRFGDRVSQTVAVLEAAESAPEANVNRVLYDMLRYYAEQGSRSRSYLLQRLSERLDQIEREQALLRQSLEANDREIESLRRQIERIGQLRRRHTGRAETESGTGEAPNGPQLRRLPRIPPGGERPGASPGFAPAPRLGQPDD